MIVFLLVRMMPGDPIEMLYADAAVVNLTPEDMAQIRHMHGLDQPIFIQYGRWLAQIVSGNLGKSLMRGFDIASEVGNRIVVTMVLGISSFIVGIILGPLLGIISAVRRGKLIDNVVAVFANIGITAPQFWVAIILLYLFGLKLGLVPIYGYTLPWVNFAQSFKSGILPVVVGSLSMIASTARQMRSSALEVLNEDYVRTSWAKGLNEKKTVLRHVLKNSLLPIVTMSGSSIRMIIGGSVIVETIFSIPGMGKMMVDGMMSQDYPVVQAMSLIMTIVVVLANLIVDLLYGWLDPRIQHT